MEAPVIKKPVPAQVINELAAYGPFYLKEYIGAPDDSALRFSAALRNGQGLPKGMICTADGILTGIPARDTQGNYEVIVTAENDVGSVQATFVMAIKPSAAAGGEAKYVDKLKAQVWEALKQNLPIPDLSEMYDRTVTKLEIYYLLERWAMLTVWDAFNLDSPGSLQPLKLEGMSEHYNVYDRGSCLVATPKDLFSTTRTVADAIQTGHAMAKEAYKRGWTVEMAGFEKMMRAFWVEWQHQEDQHGKQLEILRFDPTFKELRLYREQAEQRGLSLNDKVGRL